MEFDLTPFSNIIDVSFVDKAAIPSVKNLECEILQITTIELLLVHVRLIVVLCTSAGGV